MPDTQTILVVWSGLITAAALGLACVVKNLSDLVITLARAQQDTDTKIASLLSRTDRRSIGSEAALIEEWRAEMEASPEGSPKREAYMNRLRELGAL